MINISCPSLTFKIISQCYVICHSEGTELYLLTLNEVLCEQLQEGVILIMGGREVLPKG